MIGIDTSRTACRVMAKRLSDVCGLPESEPLWKTGRGFIVRDLPWTEEKFRAIPPFEFENWAVIALGGIPNKVQVGDMGVDEVHANACLRECSTYFTQTTRLREGVEILIYGHDKIPGNTDV